jgi:hypothetical protein
MAHMHLIAVQLRIMFRMTMELILHYIMKESRTSSLLSECDVGGQHHPHRSLIGLARLRLSGMVRVVYGEEWIFVYRLELIN